MDKNLLVAMITPKIPEMMIPSFEQAVKDLPEEKLSSVASVPMKSPTTTLILAFFLGGLGVDRFYLGDTGCGVAKLLTCGGVGIWSLIDLFTAFNRAKQANYNKIRPYLH